MNTHNDILRSAYAIAERRGHATNWSAFLKVLTDKLYDDSGLANLGSANDEQTTLRVTATPKTFRILPGTDGVNYRFISPEIKAMRVGEILKTPIDEELPDWLTQAMSKDSHKQIHLNREEGTLTYWSNFGNCLLTIGAEDWLICTEVQPGLFEVSGYSAAAFLANIEAFIP